MLVTVDTGGTKTLVASFSEDGTLGPQIKFTTPKTTTEYVKTLTQVLMEEYGGEHVDALVLAIPGIIKDGVATWCNNLKWVNFDAASAFTGLFGDAPILVENDANLGGLGEARALKQTLPVVLYITVSTGVGTGVISNGRIDPSLSHGQGGMTILEYDGVQQQWEHFASGKAIFETYHKLGRDIHNKRTWHQIADRISRGLLAHIPMIQPDLIIVGGSMGVYFDQYSEYLHNILKEKLPQHIPVPKLTQAQHPEQAVIYGCYYHALDNLADRKA